MNLKERFSAMDRADCNDLIDLLQTMLITQDQEGKESAVDAIVEIIENKPGTVIALPKTRNKYPTWKRMSGKLTISEEQLDGTPDFIIQMNERDRWSVKWRTSAQWSPQDYATLSEAQQAIESQFK